MVRSPKNTTDRTNYQLIFRLVFQLLPTYERLER